MELPSNNAGTPPSPLPIYENLFCFIDSCLSGFTPLSKTKDSNIVYEEDDITEDLVDFLEDKQESLNLDANHTFKFTNQSKQGRSRTDIGVRLGRKYVSNNRPLFCWIEAKRLPTPDVGIKRDEREYVIVSQEKENGKRKFKGNGGIQRFKEGKHAPMHPCAIMIGYIQLHESPFWLDRINTWINKLINESPNQWNSNDYLFLYESKNCQRYISKHDRTNGLGQIILQHFWIKI
jgi:hypothetical protein